MTANTLTPERLFESASTLAYPSTHQGVYYWLQNIPEQAGRTALFSGDSFDQGTCLTPKPYSIRSGVHEYGGSCFTFSHHAIYFFDAKFQQLVQQSVTNNTCTPIATFEGMQAVSLLLHEASNCLLMITEHSAEPENRNQIAFLGLAEQDNAGQSDSSESTAELACLVSGADFYSDICLSPCGEKLAWIEWDHPNMPWDSNRLMMANLSVETTANGVNLSIDNAQQVAGGLEQSASQASFLDNGDLVFALDRSDSDALPATANFSNLYAYNGETTALTHDLAEYGEAHWQFGQKRWAQTSNGDVLAVRTTALGDEWLRINRALETHEVVLKAAHIAHVFASTTSDKALCLAMATNAETAVYECSAGEAHAVCLYQPDALLAADEVVPAQAVQFQTAQATTAYAHYYPATGSAVRAEAPAKIAPMVVMVHGGPTGRTHQGLNLLKQYFCQNGFSLLDVNHRGSTGYGRAFRQSLLGQWGEFDASDIQYAVLHAIESGWADAQSVFIRGGSAGGYAVLRALTQYPDLFSGGASYYGIGNLITLAQITHKFEGKYTDRLIGEVYTPGEKSADSEFVKRSPLFFMDRVRCPMILFQGSDDKVVPPELSLEIVGTLKNLGLRHDYIEYAGEGHGFRLPKNRADALRREIDFYRTCMDN